MKDLINAHIVLRITVLVFLIIKIKVKFSTIINLVSKNSAFSLFALKLAFHSSFVVECHFKGSVSSSKTFSSEGQSYHWKTV